MSASAVAGLCRLRFRAPGSVFELAVPADVPAELIGQTFDVRDGTVTPA